MFLSTCFRALLLRLSILAVMTAFCGCTSINVLTNHVVMFNENGRLLDPTGNIDCNDPPALCKGRHLSILQYKELTDTQRETYIKDLLAGLSEAPRGPDGKGKRRLLIFVHGGLNTQKGSVERVEDLTPKIKAASYHPLFINWRSSLFYSYFNHAFFIRQGEEWKFWGPVTSPFVIAFDLGRGLLRAPLVWGSQVVAGLRTWPGTDLPYGLTPRENYLLLKNPSWSGSKNEIGIAKGHDERSGVDMTLAGVSWLVFLPLRALSIPLVDGFGTGAWDNMLRETRQLFHNPGEYKGGHQPEKAKWGLADVMQKLKEELKRESDDWEVMLVGHSMGTIVLNEMLREIPDFPVNTIVYMAAACSVRDFEQSVIPYLRQHDKTEFYNLSLHHVAEDRERWEPLKIPYLDPAMRGSLLVWVDDLFSTPLTPMDKTLGQYINFLRTEQIYSPDTLRGRIHQKEFSVGGRFTETDPQKHGDFDRFEFWEESFYRLPPPQ